MKFFSIISQIFYLLLLISSIYGLQCPFSYIQENETTFFFNSTCIEYIPQSAANPYNQVKVRTCENDGEFCPLDYKENVIGNRYCNYYRSNKVAGESCKHDLDCYSQECVSSKCTGKGFNETCASHEECDVSLACRKKDYKKYDKETGQITDKYEKTCVKQIDNHHTPCDEDNDCVNSMGCLYGVCVDYFSLQNGEVATNFKFCSSGYLHFDSRCRDIQLIVDPLRNNIKFECLGEFLFCQYKVIGSDETINQDCICPKVKKPNNGYCPRDTVNPKFNDFVSKYRHAIKSNVHTSRREDQANFDPLLLYPYFEGADKEVVETFTYKGISTVVNLRLSAISIFSLIIILLL